MAVHPWMIFITLSIMFLLSAKGISQADGANKGHDGGKGGTRHSGEDLVVEACKYIADRVLEFNRVQLEEKTCISVLHSDSRSTTAKGYGDLVVIAFDLLRRRTSEVAVKVGEFTHAPRNIAELNFQYCTADYAAMMSTLPVCRSIFLDLKPWGKKTEYHDAMLALDCVDRLGKAASDCYGYLGFINNMTQEFINVTMYASLAWSLMEMALNYFDDHSEW